MCSLHSPAIALAVVAVLAPSARAQQVVIPGYELVRLTDDWWYENHSDLNGCGEAAWTSRVEMDWYLSEVFFYDGYAVLQLTDDERPDSILRLNDHGQIVWETAVVAGGPMDIVWFDGASIQYITYDDASNRAPSINDSGWITWDRFSDDGCSAADTDVLLFDGEQIQSITNEQFSQYATLSSHVNDINRSGDIVYARYNFCVSPWESDIIVYHDGQLLQLTDGERSPQVPHLNDHLEVVWESRDENNTVFIKYWKDGQSRIVFPTGFSPFINNRGDIAATRYATDERWEAWIRYAGTDELVRVVADIANNYLRALNDDGEMLIQRGAFPDTDVYYLRRIRSGEMDFDGDVDLVDLVSLQNCLTGPAPTRLCACRFADIDFDRDVDLADIARFQQNFTGGDDPPQLGHQGE